MKPRKVESQTAAAAMLNVPLSEVQRAKRNGCPAFELGGRIDLAKLRRWRARHPLRQAPRPTVTPGEIVEGISAARKRLAKEEARSYAAMVAATDPVDRDRKHKEWLQTSAVFHRRGLLTDEGELIPRSEVERVLNAAFSAFHQAVQECATRVAEPAMGCDHAGRLRALLRDAFWQAAYIASAAAISTWRLPDWVTDAIRQGIGGAYNVTPEGFAAIITEFRELAASAAANSANRSRTRFAREDEERAKAQTTLNAKDPTA